MEHRLSALIHALFRRNQAERDLDEELRYHLENATRQNISRGMTADEARRQALISLGGLQAHKEICRDARGGRPIEEFLQDVRYASRVLRRTPGFTLVVVLMLALGIGANTAIFSLVDKLLLSSLPVNEPDRLVKVSAESVNPKFLNTIFSYPDYLDYREQNQVFEGLLAHAERTVTLGQGDESRRVSASFVSWNYFSVMRTKLRGRGFAADEEAPENPAPVAVISYGLWASLGADPEIIGKTLDINQSAVTVVGIAGREFRGDDLEYPTDIWVPLGMIRTLPSVNIVVSNRRLSWLALMGRMRPGMDIGRAAAGMETVAQSIFLANTPVADRGLPFNEKHIILTPGGKGSSYLRTELGPALKLMTCVAALLLLIACANIAGLLLGRGAAQRKEVAIRLALGASRGRLIRFLLAQSGMLMLIGAGFGLVLAPWIHRLLLAFEPGINLTGSVIEQGLDLRALGFTLCI
ncbi:MAG TPA: ABC transporter permease, partial [Blastocatellia bacterium]